MVNQSMDVGSISSYIVCGTGDTIVHGISNSIIALLIHCFSSITLHYYQLGSQRSMQETSYNEIGRKHCNLPNRQ